MIVDRGVIASALPGYEVGGQIGSGAFGLVLTGRDRLHRDVAIKVLPGLPGSTGGGGPPDAEAEALTLASLDHPHVVRVYDYVRHGDLALIVMELLGGGSLRTRVAQAFWGDRPPGAGPDVPTDAASGSGGRPPLGVVCAVGLAAAAGLGYAHSRDVLHRDVKPANLLFTAPGQLKVADFGVAKVFGGGPVTLASRVVGTPRYMAPEQFRLGQIGPPADLYGLGVVLHELLVGSPPAVALPGPAASSPSALRGVPPELAAVVRRALAADVRGRYATARDLAVALGRAAAACLGPDWLERVGLPLHLDDEVRAAATTAPSTRGGPPSAGVVTTVRTPAGAARFPIGDVRSPAGGARPGFAAPPEPRGRPADPAADDLTATGATQWSTPPSEAAVPGRSSQAIGPAQALGPPRAFGPAVASGPGPAGSSDARSDARSGAVVVNLRDDAEYRRLGRRAALAAAIVGLAAVVLVTVIALLL